ncbi:hypothetical protein LZ30DRAFT_786466 [Colletotrichum cereale]|nr:hypothetical protein LZ30DRAFT_786466 [Colletotrichum cereale]
MDFILESRIPKGGGGSRGGSSSKSSKSKSKTSKYKSKGGHVVTGGSGGGGGGGEGGLGALPLWARILIIVLIVWFILFLIAFTYYLVQELKRKKQGQKFRLGHVLGHALLVSTGLWVPVFLYKKFAAHRKNKSGESESSARGGVYAKIEEGRADDSGSGSNRDSWYAGAAAGNTNNNAAESKYEPMGYAPYRSQTPVPPHAPSAATGQTGAAAEYYLPQPPSNTAPPQHPPQYN